MAGFVLAVQQQIASRWSDLNLALNTKFQHILPLTTTGLLMEGPISKKNLSEAFSEWLTTIRPRHR